MIMHATPMHAFHLSIYYYNYTIELFKLDKTNKQPLRFVVLLPNYSRKFLVFDAGNS